LQIAAIIPTLDQTGIPAIPILPERVTVARKIGHLGISETLR
jgi:hypothetical protein